MSEQAKAVGVSDKMKAKDYITLGIFTVLFFAVVMVCIFASAATVVTFAFGSAIAAIPGGIIYMLMRAKVPKAGSVLLSGVVIGLIEFLIGAGWAVAVGFIAGAVIAELLARIGHYKSFWLNTIGYSVYMMFFALGTYLPKRSSYTLSIRLLLTVLRTDCWSLPRYWSARFRIAVLSRSPMHLSQTHRSAEAN